MDFVYTINRNNPNIGTVYARIRQNGINKKYSIKYHITPTEWDNYIHHRYNSDTIILSLKIRYEEFSMILDLIKHHICTDFSPKSIRAKIQKSKTEVLYGVEESELIYDSNGKFVDEYLSRYYDDLISGKRLKIGRGVKVSISYAKQFLFLRNRIKEFQRSRCHHFTFEDIDIHFRNDFIVWLKSKYFSYSSVYNCLKMLRRIMMSAYEEGLTDNDIRKFDGFCVPYKETEDIYLSQEQMEELYSLDFKSDTDVKELIKNKVAEEKEREKYCKEVTPQIAERLRKCLDIFLVGLFTGQRLGDYSRINVAMLTTIKDEWYIHLVQDKTKRTVYIPLDKRVKQILEKYGGELPRCSYNHINQSIKQICRYMGWNLRTGIKHYYLGKAKDDRFASMVRTHTARRSFVTNAYIAGVSVRSIMAITGHISEQGMRRYIKIDTEENSIIAAEDLDGFMEL